MNLYLIRHAKTEKVSTSGKDFDRKLAEKGIAQAKKINEFIAKFNFNDVDIWCSDAMRTKQTLAEIDSNFPSENIEFKNELYLASAKEICKLIWKSESKKDLLIIGHNEGISDIATYFIRDVDWMHLKTSTFLQISFDAENRQEWSYDLGTLISLFRPEV